MRALSHPPREFLAERLGLRTPDPDQWLPEDEPFDGNDGLARWQLDMRVFELGLDGGQDSAQDSDTPAGRAALAARLLAEGRIAPGAAGHDALRQSLQRIAPALLAWRAPGGQAMQPRPWQLDLSAFRLAGVLPLVHAGGLRQFSASKAHGRNLIGLGVDALVWSALGETRPVERFTVATGRPAPPATLAPTPQAQARAKLESLLALAARARLEVLPFMPKAGLVMWNHAGDVAAGERAARKSWHGDHGEAGDAAVRIALRGAMPFDDAAQTRRLSALAAEIFSGLPGVPQPDPPASDASASAGDD